MMPLYIPWLTETIKKRGVRYLLHHYLGQFFEEKLTLEQLSIDIYEGKGSIRNLALDVDGLNDELDFIPFKFLDGCLIGQISVEVPWSSLATEACRVELEGAKFVCRLKTSADGSKVHCTESTLLSRSLMTSSMQMAEDIVTEEDDQYDSPNSSIYRQQQPHSGQDSSGSKRKDANQMFEGLEMFALLIDSVLRRTKLTARNTLFQIQPHRDDEEEDQGDDDDDNDDDDDDEDDDDNGDNKATSDCNRSSTSGDEFAETTGAKSDSGSSESANQQNSSQGTVEFFIKFFRCEEIIDQSARSDLDAAGSKMSSAENNDEEQLKRPLSAMPETITKLLTLEDVEMRIGGIPVSNLIGKHTIMIKFNGQKSEISVFSGSPLLAVIGHEQLQTFFNVFDGSRDRDYTNESNLACERNQKIMSPEDYAKIENQLLESASLRTVHQAHMNELGGFVGGSNHHVSSSAQAGGGRRWVDSGDLFSSSMSSRRSEKNQPDQEYDYHSPNSSSTATCLDGGGGGKGTAASSELEPSLDNIEAFSCELKLPGIWLCILRDGEAPPPLIKPYADSINSFQTINKYIEEHIKVPHIRLLALKVALDITSAGTNVFLGDLDISEHLQDDSMNPTLHLLHNDLTNFPMNSSRYKAFITNNNKEITVDLLTKTRITFDPTMIDRIVYDYKLIKFANQPAAASKRTSGGKGRVDQGNNCATSNSGGKQRNPQLDLNLTIRGEQFKIELLCPIPDLTPEAQAKPTQLRPQSFLFDFKSVALTWQSDKLKVSAKELIAYVKTQPQQGDNEAIKFIEATCKNNDRIVLTLEPSPSNLDTAFPNDIEQALNESSLYDSIYVGQATESRLPTEAFQTKRKVVRASIHQSPNSTTTAAAGNITNKQQHETSGKISDCDNEKIITPGDRQHLLDYLNQTVMSTKLSLSLHLPICEVEFEDKEQLDLIYNRFGNDFVFWQPKAFMKNHRNHHHHAQHNTSRHSGSGGEGRKKVHGERKNSDTKGHFNHHHHSKSFPLFKQPLEDSDHDDYDEDEDNHDDDSLSEADTGSDQESEVSFHSLSVDGSSSDYYDNEVTCKITVDELFIRFNHQSCAAALKQEISAENLLLGVLIDVNKKPSTILSLVADNLELSTDSDIVLEGNTFGDKNSILSLTAEIKRPNKSLKDIKLAIQLVNGLFNDFKTEIFTRFWQSVNVTDEPISGYVAPKIVTELHIDILNTALSLVRDGARPALLSIDELYLTSMVMEQTSQVMIRLIADEVSLYLKRNKQGVETMKNYICLIDSGLIDLDVKFSQDNRLEFGVINNVITVRACQDSLSALCKLFNVMAKSSEKKSEAACGGGTATNSFDSRGGQDVGGGANGGPVKRGSTCRSGQSSDDDDESVDETYDDEDVNDADEISSSPEAMRNAQERVQNAREMNLLEDAMNDYSETTSITTTTTTATATKADKRKETASASVPTSTFENRESSSSSSSSEEDSDSDDVPPVIQTTTDNNDPNTTCLLDRSNPHFGDFFSQPLLPASSAEKATTAAAAKTTQPNDDSSTAETFNSTKKSIDESGFFVIGDDDVGAGIMDKQQQEPVVRKLIDGPINIVENHFKMTKPRTLPEMLASSLERYVLEEMTLVVNLYGGRDFDDENPNEDGATTASATTTSEDQADLESLDYATSVESSSLRSGAGSSLAGATNRKSSSSSATTTATNRKTYSSESSSSLLKKKAATTGLGGRRKHLSEGGSRDLYGSSNNKGHSMEPRVRFGEGAVNLWESLDLMSSPDFLGARKPSQPPLSSDTKTAGGAWRQTDVCIQLTLTKVKLLYEIGDKTSPISWRFMLFIHDIEIKDRIHASDINKMLYEYCTESMPKRNTQILTIKNVATINPSDGCEECDLRVSLKPLRLNIDQDTLLFLIEFFTSLGKSLTRQQSVYGSPPGRTTSTSSAGAAAASPAAKIDAHGGANSGRPKQHQQDLSPTSTLSRAADGNGGEERGHRARKGSQSQTRRGDGGVGGGVQIRRRRQQSERSDTSLSFGSCSSTASSAAPPPHHAGSSTRRSSSSLSTTTTAATTATTTTTTQTIDSGGASSLPTHCHSDSVAGATSQHPIYIKSFTFSPDVPIRLDYHAKHLDFEQGALAGILMGLAHLDHSELVLRRVQAKHGMRGLDRVVLFILNSWMSDIKRNQLPSILSGVGPMHSVIQLFQGMRDLIWMPIDHYRKDRRLVRGLQRGASSFSSSTAMAAINLMNRFISIVQCTAQIAHDIVTPPTMQRSSNGRGRDSYKARSGGAHMAGQTSSSSSLGANHRRHGVACSSSSSIAALNQPRNFCEGVAVGFTILKEGFNDTARNVAVGMQAEDVRSAVGELVRQIPSTLLNPIISATEGAQNVLVGIRNQIAPDARREDQEKWKRRVRGK